MEESDASDLSGANAVADGDLDGLETGASFTFANDDSGFKIGYHGNKRYCRLTITPAGNSSGAPISILAVGEPRVKPAT